MKYMTESDRFNINEFLAPPIQNAPIYSWVWNGPVTREETDRQLCEMVRLGIRAFYIIPEPKLFRPTIIPTYLEPDYLTKPYFEEVRYAMERARELGMQSLLYDEGGWPSGGACGKVVLEHPEFAQRSLSVRSIPLPANTPYTPSADAIGAFINTTDAVCGGAQFDTDTEIEEYFIETKLCELKGRPTADVPDVTLPEATDEFIKITHEAYKPYLEEFFGNTVAAVFTDEPTAPRPLFRDDLIKKFEAKQGYSILPYLPYIKGKAEAKDDAAEAVCAWFDLCSREFCENYLIKEKKWSNDNGLCYLGHMDVDHLPYASVMGGTYNLMRALRCLDVPGVDAIWRQIFPCEKKAINDLVVYGENGFFPRYASSAAAQTGSRYALTETFGVYGAGLTYDEMRWVIAFQAIRGINIYNLMLIPYRRRGVNLAGELPSFTEEQAHVSKLSHFNSYLERLSYLTSLGKRECEVALYIPIRDMYCGGDTLRAASDGFIGAGERLERLHIDFDIIDDDVILAADGSDTITMGDASYKTIVLGNHITLTPALKQKLDSFVAAGGKVVSYAEIDTLAPTLDFIEGGEGLIVMRRATENGEMALVFNQNLGKTSFIPSLEGDGWAMLELMDGELLDYQNGTSVSLEAGELIGFIKLDTISDKKCKKEYTSQTELCGFEFKRLSRMVLGYMDIETEKYNEDAHPVALGDWCNEIGKRFSGTCSYSTTFELCADSARIELGDVKYTAELYLNGEYLGTRVMKPYVFDVPTPLCGKNTLEVRVTNTPANEHLYTDTFDKWQTWQLTPYHEKQKEFHKDSLPSGLFGPVTIKY